MAATASSSYEARLQAASRKFQTIQDDLQKAVEVRQRLDSQLAENLQVKKEFSLLTPNEQIYKLLGPGLIKQDQAEAKTNVEKRIEFIKEEITRVEKQLQDLSEKGEKAKGEIIQIQTEAQQAAAAAAGGSVGGADGVIDEALAAAS